MVSFDGMNFVPIIPAEYSIHSDGEQGDTTIVEEDSEYCGYEAPIEPIYRWSDTDGYICGEYRHEKCETDLVSNDGNTYEQYVLGDLRAASYSAKVETSAITEAYIGTCVTSITGAFFRAYSLTKCVIPNTVTSINYASFSQCTSLEQLTIPVSVTSFAQYCFNGSSKLTALDYEGTKEQWNAITKNSNWARSSAIKTIHCTDGDVTL